MAMHVSFRRMSANVTPACVTGNGNPFIAPDSGTHFCTGLELDQTTLEPRVQPELPQSISMTGVEFKNSDWLQTTENQQEGGGRL